MSNRPKAKGKIQYGTPAPGSPGAPKTGDSGPMGAKIAIGAVIAAVLVTLIVFAVKDSGGDTGNTVAFQPATVTGTPLPTLSDTGEDPAVGMTIPTVVGKSFDGSKITIEPGEPQIVAVIAHWCPHCQKEVPLVAGWQKSGELTDKVKVTAVSTAAAEVKGNFPPASWLEREEWKNPTMVDTPTSKVQGAFGVTGYPTLIAVKADGTVAKRASGELTLEQVKDLFNAALGKETTTDATPGTTPITSPVPTTAAP